MVFVVFNIESANKHRLFDIHSASR